MAGVIVWEELISDDWRPEIGWSFSVTTESLFKL
jgi:hypothetical protein